MLKYERDLSCVIMSLFLLTILFYEALLFYGSRAKMKKNEANPAVF